MVDRKCSASPSLTAAVAWTLCVAGLTLVLPCLLLPPWHQGYNPLGATPPSRLCSGASPYKAPTHFSDLSKPPSSFVFLRTAKTCMCSPKGWSVVAICAGGHGESTEDLDSTSGVPRHVTPRALREQDAAYTGLHFSHSCAANHPKTSVA